MTVDGYLAIWKHDLQQPRNKLIFSMGGKMIV